MERIPILKLGEFLLVSIQIDMHDRLAISLQDDLTGKIVATGAKGVLIDISALDIEFAAELDYNIKLLGLARLTAHGIEQRVHACMVPRATPIAEFDVPKSSPQAIMLVPFHTRRGSHLCQQKQRCQTVSFRLC